MYFNILIQLHLLNSCQGAHRKLRSCFKFISTFHHLPVLCYSKCGPWTSNSSITWEPVRTRGSQASPESSESESDRKVIWLHTELWKALIYWWSFPVHIMNKVLFLILLVHHLLLPFLGFELRFPRQTKLFPVSGLLSCCSLCLGSIFSLFVLLLPTLSWRHVSMHLSIRSFSVYLLST